MTLTFAKVFFFVNKITQAMISKIYSFAFCSFLVRHLLKNSNVLFLFSFLFFCTNVSAQIVTQQMSDQDYVEKLVGPGITFSNVQRQGHTNSIRYFTGGFGSGLPGINSGIILCTGDVSVPTCLQGHSVLTNSTEMNTPGFPELNALSGFNTRDGIMLLT